MGPQSKAQSKGTLPYVGQIGNNPLNDKNFLPPPPSIWKCYGRTTTNADVKGCWSLNKGT